MTDWRFPEPNGLLTITNSEGEMLVSIDRDGSMTFGPNYDPDEAAQTFWDALAAHHPRFVA